MEGCKNDEQAIVVWETSAKATGGAESETGTTSARVVPLRADGSGNAGEGEPVVVSRSMPGRNGVAGTILYVGSGFWTRAVGGSSAASSPRMAA